MRPGDAEVPLESEIAAPASAPALSTHVRWTLLGTAANSATAWLVIVILARSSGPAAVGAYALPLALTAPVMAFVALQLRTLVATDTRGEYAFAEYLRLNWATTFVGLAACAGVALIAGQGGGWAVLAGVCAMRAADGFGEIYLALWQRHEQMRVIGIGRLVQLFVSLALVGGAALFGGGPTATAAGAALGSAAMVAFLHFETMRAPELRRAAAAAAPWRWDRLGRLALQGLPLGIITLLGTLQSNVPRYFIEHHAGKAALGLFAAASQLTSSGTLFVGAISGAALPRLSRWSTTDSDAFEALTRKLVLIGVALGVLGVATCAVAGRAVLVFLYRPEFAEAEETLLVLSVAAGLGFVASFLGWALTASRVINIQPVLLLVTLAVLVAGCAVLTSRHGAVGASWALVAGYAVQVGMSVIVLRRSRSRLRPDRAGL